MKGSLIAKLIPITFAAVAVVLLYLWLSADGEMIEQIKFADITIGGDIARSALAPTMSCLNAL